jgi:hypothetical protein
MTTVALAGLAAQELLYELLIAWAWLGLVVILVGVTFYRASPIAFAVTAVLLLFFSLVTEPWQCFVVPSESDPALVLSDSLWRGTAFIWIFVCAATAASTVPAWRGRKRDRRYGRR